MWVSRTSLPHVHFRWVFYSRLQVGSNIVVNANCRLILIVVKEATRVLKKVSNGVSRVGPCPWMFVGFSWAFTSDLLLFENRHSCKSPPHTVEIRSWFATGGGNSMIGGVRFSWTPPNESRKLRVSAGPADFFNPLGKRIRWKTQCILIYLV